MPNYQQGKIYKMFVGDVVYIGSTISSLHHRLSQHRCRYNLWKKNGSRYSTSCDIFELGEPKMEIIILYPCNSRKELEEKEGEIIRQNKCVNKLIAGRDKKEYNKLYRTLNKEKDKEYRQSRKEIKKEYDKEYKRRKIITNQHQ